MAPLPMTPAPRKAVTMLRLFAKDSALKPPPPPARSNQLERGRGDGLFADKADGDTQVRYCAGKLEYAGGNKAGEQ